MTTLPVPSPTAEELLTRILDDLRACLCTAIDDTCYCGIYPGGQVVADFCGCKGAGGCGMAWVRLARVFPSAQAFPGQDSKPGNCVSILAATIEVGVFRCQPLPQSSTGTPDPAALTDAAISGAEDAMGMARAIQCCEAITSRPHVLGAWEPRSQGDCGGGVWTVTVQLRRR